MDLYVSFNANFRTPISCLRLSIAGARKLPICLYVLVAGDNIRVSDSIEGKSDVCSSLCDLYLASGSLGDLIDPKNIGKIVGFEDGTKLFNERGTRIGT